MKKYCLIVLVLISFSLPGITQDKGIIFETGSFDEILQKAQKENKIIMLDAYTTWCGPCKTMTENVFTDKKVADYYNTHFINAKFDMEKGEGIEIKKSYEVKAYPTILFINGKGEKVHIGVGSSKAKDFIKLGETAKNPEANLAYYQKVYEKEKNDPIFLAQYFKLLKRNYIPYEEKLNTYWKTQKTEELIEKENWALFKDFVKDTDTKEFKYLRENKALFIKEYGKKEVEQVIYEIMSTKMFNAVKNAQKDHQIYFSAKEDIKQLNYHREKEVLLNSDMTFYRFVEEQPEKYTDAAIELYALTNDKSELRKALRRIERWKQKAIEAGEDSKIFDTMTEKLKEAK
jgi:thioredoxin-related protein